jgi:hypothetical protein
MKKFVSGFIGMAFALSVWYAVKPKPPKVVSKPPVEQVIEQPQSAEELTFIDKKIFIVNEFSEADKGLSISIDFSHEGFCVIYSNTAVEGRAFHKALLEKKWDVKYALRFDDVTTGVAFVDIEVPMVSYEEFITAFLAVLKQLNYEEFTINGHPAIMSYLKAGINSFPEDEPKKEPKVEIEDIPTIEPVAEKPVARPVVKKAPKKKSPPPRRTTSKPRTPS